MNDHQFRPLRSQELPSILVVEDSEHDYDMLVWAIKKSQVQCKIYHCGTGDEALQFLQDQLEPTPKALWNLNLALVLLDLNLPGVDGRVVLERIKKHPTLGVLPVVIFSTSTNPKDIESCYRHGANAYIMKPMDVKLLQESVTYILKHWLNINISYFQIIFNSDNQPEDF